MNTRDAAHMTGHNYPGGVPALAARMGMDARELSLELSHKGGHAIGLDKSVLIMALTGDHRILQAMANELGYVLTLQPDESGK